MMSQDSIKNYVEDADKETHKEKKRLENQDSQKKQFAKKVLMRQQVGDGDQDEMAAAGSKVLTNNSLQKFGGANGKTKLFGKFVDGTEKKDRLQDLLEKVTEYTSFILQQNKKSHLAQQRQKMSGQLSIGNGA